MADETEKSKSTHAAGIRPRRPKVNQSLDDALDWLGYEVANVTREAQLRTQDATDFVTKYASGQISEQEFQKRQHAYSERWGEALRGVIDCRGMSDEAVLQDIAERRQRRSQAYSAGRN